MDYIHQLHENIILRKKEKKVAIGGDGKKDDDPDAKLKESLSGW